jgi:plasmid stability protein
MDAVEIGRRRGSAMNAIIIRTISAEAIARIEERAALHHRTVEEEAAAILETALSAPLGPRERYLLAERIAAMTPKDVPQTDSVDLLREDRDR